MRRENRYKGFHYWLRRYIIRRRGEIEGYASEEKLAYFSMQILSACVQKIRQDVISLRSRILLRELGLILWEWSAVRWSFVHEPNLYICIRYSYPCDYAFCMWGLHFYVCTYVRSVLQLCTNFFIFHNGRHLLIPICTCTHFAKSVLYRLPRTYVPTVYGTFIQN